MIKSILSYLIFLTVCFTVGCNVSEPKSEVEKIQGSWLFDTSNLPVLKQERIISKVRDNCGFQFDGDKCHLNCSFYTKDLSNVCFGMRSGYVTNFKIQDDSLKIWDNEKNRWHYYLIKKLTADSLIILDTNMQYSLKYIKPVLKLSDENIYDAIVVSKRFTGEDYDCTDESFYLNKVGDFYYNNHEGIINSGKLNDQLVNSLFSNFKFLDVNKLDNEYVGGGTGGSVTYCIVFLKNNNVVKRVIDQQNTSPDELLIGYVPMVNTLNKITNGVGKFDSNILELIKQESKWFSNKMGSIPISF